MGQLYPPKETTSYLAAVLAGYRRVVAVRTELLYDRSWPHITHLRTAEGLIVTREEAVRDLLEGRYHYYTYEDGNVAMLIVEHSGLSRYVRSRPDCSYANNLLHLPRF